MDRTFALQAEVLGGAHESLPEEHLPEVVHGHAGGQRVLLGGQPTGQSEAVAGSAFRPADQRLRDVRGDLGAVLIPDAAHEHEGVAGLLALGKDHDVELAARRLGFAELTLGPLEREA
jgi:hypothetical protein